MRSVKEMTTYQMRLIGQRLRRGDARIAGLTSLSYRWPDKPHAWIIEDLIDHVTHHVPITTRPTWARHYQAGERQD